MPKKTLLATAAGRQVVTKKYVRPVCTCAQHMETSTTHLALLSRDDSKAQAKIDLNHTGQTMFGFTPCRRRGVATSWKSYSGDGTAKYCWKKLAYVSNFAINHVPQRRLTFACMFVLKASQIFRSSQRNLRLSIDTFLIH